MCHHSQATLPQNFDQGFGQLVVLYIPYDRRVIILMLSHRFLLVASCITMGGSGIWAMHFIGNRAIVLNDGVADQQISYSPGFTALSFFLPILVLSMAFYFLASTSHARSLYIVLAGILAGTAICGMHFLGNYGIANYDCHYRIENVVGAAVIAVVASLIALSVFFRLRETWTDTWWKRTLCAAMLASAVAGMHWTAVVGTSYRFKGVGSGTKDTTRVQTVIVCAVLVRAMVRSRTLLTAASQCRLVLSSSP